MKQTLFTFLLISALGMASCRKDKLQLTIKQYDQQQIESYIAAHGLTGMHRDTTGGDTTGMYYQILYPGTQSINGTPVTPLDYPDEIAFVYTERTFDGTYVLADTIINHYYDYVGHIQTGGLTLGLQTAVHNLLKYPDASMRVLVPSHLAFGRNGTGSGSSQVANNRIAGNECLDIYVHAVNNFQTYDDLVIQHYMRDSSLTGYTAVKIPAPVPQLPIVYWAGKYSTPQVPDSGTYYYKILTPAVTDDPITANSTATVTYTATLLNGTVASNYNVAGGTPYSVATLVPAVTDALEKFAVAGTKISIILPSALGYGVPPSGIGAPYSCLRYTFVVVSVTP